MDSDGYAAPFPVCVRLPGHFGGSCANCKWPDRAASCSNGDLVPPRTGGGGSLGTRERPVDLLGAPGASVEDPIELDEDGAEDHPIVLD